jgi:hypothetical protein
MSRSYTAVPFNSYMAVVGRLLLKQDVRWIGLILVAAVLWIKGIVGSGKGSHRNSNYVQISTR